jgi:hypothetical protein
MSHEARQGDGTTASAEEGSESARLTVGGLAARVLVVSGGGCAGMPLQLVLLARLSPRVQARHAIMGKTCPALSACCFHCMLHFVIVKSPAGLPAVRHYPPESGPAICPHPSVTPSIPLGSLTTYIMGIGLACQHRLTAATLSACPHATACCPGIWSSHCSHCSKSTDGA